MASACTCGQLQCLTCTYDQSRALAALNDREWALVKQGHQGHLRDIVRYYEVEELVTMQSDIARRLQAANCEAQDLIKEYQDLIKELAAQCQVNTEPKKAQM